MLFLINYHLFLTTQCHTLLHLWMKYKVTPVHFPVCSWFFSSSLLDQPQIWVFQLIHTKLLLGQMDQRMFRGPESVGWCCNNRDQDTWLLKIKSLPTPSSAPFNSSHVFHGLSSPSLIPKSIIDFWWGGRLSPLHLNLQKLEVNIWLMNLWDKETPECFSLKSLSD